MGMCAEKTAVDLGISREDQDAFAKESYLRAQHALANNLFASEIVDVIVKSRGTSRIVISLFLFSYSFFSLYIVL